MAGKKKVKKIVKKTDYLMFCENDTCHMPQQIPEYILKTYFATEVPGVYCSHCNHLNPVPEYLRKIAGEL